MGERDIFNKRCRLCCAWKISLSINLFSEDSKRSDLISKIKTYLKLEVSHKDGLPELVCYQCLYQIESFHSFKKKCEEAEHTLKNWIFFFEGKKPIKESDVQPEIGIDLQIANYYSLATEYTEQVYPQDTDITNKNNSIPEPQVVSCVSPIESLLFEQDENMTTKSWIQKHNKDPNNISVIEIIDAPNSSHIQDHQKTSTQVMQKDIKSIIRNKNNVCPIDVVPSTSNCKDSNSIPDRVGNQKNITLNYLGLNRTSKQKLHSSHESLQEVAALPEEIERETHSKKAACENIIVSPISSAGHTNNSDLTSKDMSTESFGETRVLTSPQLPKSEIKHPVYVEKENLTMMDKLVIKSSKVLVKEMKNVQKETEIVGGGKARVETINNPTSPVVQKSRKQCNQLAQDDCLKDTHNTMKMKFQRKRIKKEICSPGSVSDLSGTIESDLDVGGSNNSESSGENENMVNLKNQQLMKFKEELEENQFLNCMFIDTVKSDSGSIRYSCFICNKNFSTKHYVKEHMKIHTGERSFICAVCNRRFRNKYMLRAHMRVHVPQRDFKCNTCGKLFKDKYALQGHMLIHSERRTFICKECGTGFKQVAGLRRHLRVHSGEKPYKCRICHKAYADYSMRSKHMRTHTGERPYKCDECGSTFQDKFYLKSHKRTHTNERPFRCLICDTGFRAKGHLVKHLSCIHKDVMKSVVTFMKDKL